MPEPSKYYTIAEVADTLRVTPKTVWQLCREHKIPATKPAGQWLIPVAEFDAWVAAGSNEAATA